MGSALRSILSAAIALLVASGAPGAPGSDSPKSVAQTANSTSPSKGSSSSSIPSTSPSVGGLGAGAQGSKGSAPSSPQATAVPVAPSAIPTGSILASPVASAPTPEELGVLLEAARRRLEAGGPGVETELRRVDLLLRLLRPAPQAPDTGGDPGREGLDEYAARIERLRDPAGDASELRPVSEISRSLEAEGALRQHRTAHLAAVDAELADLESDLRYLDSLDSTNPATGTSPGFTVERRGLVAARKRLADAREEAARALQRSERRLGLLETELALGRNRIRVEASDLERKRAEIEAAEAEVRRMVEVAAAQLAQTREAQRVAELEASRAQEQLARASDDATRRVLVLKGELAEESRLAAVEAAELARARQEGAKAQAERYREELAHLSRLRRLGQGEVPEAELANLLQEARRDLQGVEREVAAEEAKLDWARSVMDRGRARRRELQVREADLLAPDLPREKRPAAWVLRQVLAKVDERQDLSAEIRDARREILKLRSTRVSEIRDLVEDLAERIRSAERARASATSEPERPGPPKEAPLDHAAGFGLDLAEGLRKGALAEVLYRAASAAHRSAIGLRPGFVAGLLILATLAYLAAWRLLVWIDRGVAESQVAGLEWDRARSEYGTVMGGFANRYRWRAVLLGAIGAGIRPLSVGLFAKLVGELLPTARSYLDLAALAAASASLVATARHMIDRFLDPSDPDRLLVEDVSAAGLFHDLFRRLLFWSGLLVPVCALWPRLGYRPGLEPLLWFGYKLLVSWLILTGLMQKRRVVRLVRPEAGTGYRMLHSLLEHTYTLVSGFVLVLLVLWGGGYEETAAFMARAGVGTALIAILSAALWSIIDRILPASDRLDPGEAEPSEEIPEGLSGTRRRRVTWTVQDLARLSLKSVLGVAAGSATYLAWGGALVDLSLVARLYQATFSVGGIQISVSRLVEAGIYLGLCTGLSTMIRGFLDRQIFPNTPFDPGICHAINSALHYGLLGIAGLLSIETFGVGTETLKWFAGFAGVGIGFGMQTIVNNLASGIILLIERPIKPGDRVRVGDVEGEVTRISVRATVIKTLDNVETVVPNSEFVGAPVTNWSYSDPTMRLHVRVGVAYGSDVKAVKDALLKVARSHRLVLGRPLPEVQFVQFGESSLDFVLLVWISYPFLAARITSDLNFAIDAEFRRRGIEVPFPQRDLHIRSGLPLERFARLLRGEADPDAGDEEADGTAEGAGRSGDSLAGPVGPLPGGPTPGPSPSTSRSQDRDPQSHPPPPSRPPRRERP